MLGPWIKVNWKWSNRRWQEWMNIDILEISELKWTGMGKFNSDDHYIYYCGQESVRKKWSSHHSQQKSLKCSTWMQFQKWQNNLCSFPRQTNIRVIQAYAPTSNAEEAEVEWFYEGLQDLLELTPKKYVLFIIGDWNAKVGSQDKPGVTGKFGLGVQNEAGKG